MSFDAPIVPNLCLIENQDRVNHQQSAAAVVRPQANQQSRALLTRSPEQCQFTLVLATQSNHVYNVMFERFYLQKGRTIFVKSSDDAILEHL